jgi:hypothetical protein
LRHGGRIAVSLPYPQLNDFMATVVLDKRTNRIETQREAPLIRLRNEHEERFAPVICQPGIQFGQTFPDDNIPETTREHLLLRRIEQFDRMLI